MTTLLCCIAAIGLHLGSTHIDNHTGQSLNNVNPGLYVELTNGITIGSYRNSINRDSYYVGYNHRFAPIMGVTPSVMVGGITGYSHGGRAVQLAAVPSLSYNVGSGAEVRLSYVPKTNLTMVHTLHLSVERRF